MIAEPLIFADEPALAEVAAYWQRQRQGEGQHRRLPDRADIDPLHLSAEIWPNLLLSEPAEDGKAFRYRLVGSAHVERYAFDFTGRTTAEIMQGSYRDYMQHIYGAAFHAATPVYSESVFRWDAQGFAMTRRLMLPLSHGEADRPAMVLTVQVWPTAMPVQPRSIGELSRSGGFRDGIFYLLDRDSFAVQQQP